jgi:hypothetical protein
MSDQLEAAHAERKADLGALLHAGDTWEIA